MRIMILIATLLIVGAGAGYAEEYATDAQVAAYGARHGGDYWLFCEDRSQSIKRRDALPARWLTQEPATQPSFSGEARPDEFYVFQVGVYAAKADLGAIQVRFSDLAGDNGAIAADRLRCFHLGGVDYLGKPFSKEVTVKQGRVQALWMGVQVPKDAVGAYVGTVTIAPAGAPETIVRLELTVAGDPIEDHGDLDPSRLSRLRWLDSTIGLDDEHVVKPYLPVKRDGNSLSILGRRIHLGDNGMPASIQSFFSANNTKIVDAPTEILEKPLALTIETEAGPIAWTKRSMRFVSEKPARVTWQSRAQAQGLTLVCDGTLEPEGALSMRCTLTVEKETALTDVRLEAAISDAASKYFMGLGRRGSKMPPKSVETTWHPDRFHDAFWVGGVNAGLRFKLKGANYHEPLPNSYYQFRKMALPKSWHNDGKGGIRVTPQDAGGVQASAWGGPRTMAAGESLVFQVELLISPYKLIDTDHHWKTRYFHKYKGDAYRYTRDPALVKKAGANVLNIHHNQEPNPVINYPYWECSFPLLQECVKKAHENDVMVKIYYTAREITNNLPELHAFHSLNGEIIFPGPPDARTVTNKNGPHPWLKEHLREDFIPAWRENLEGRYHGTLDLAVITTPNSRLDNFYLEGLDYLIRHAGIDGAYIDGSSLGRTTFQRVRRIFEKHKERFELDLHIWDGTMRNPQWGKINPILRYGEILPYVDRLWVGEAYHYNQVPEDYWLVEISGIPFGVMGDMLQDGGNAWRGMVYGMTPRMGWTAATPRHVWNVWDEFGMEGSDMIGYWDPEVPVRSDNPRIPVTVYRKDGKALLSLASWTGGVVDCRLEIDFEVLGVDPKKARLRAPDIRGFQVGEIYAVDAAIPVKHVTGKLLILEEGPTDAEETDNADR